jgi:hypothetical protein
MSSAPFGYADKRVVFDLLEDMRQAWKRVLNDYARTHGGSSPRRTPRSAGRSPRTPCAATSSPSPCGVGCRSMPSIRATGHASLHAMPRTFDALGAIKS